MLKFDWNIVFTLINLVVFYLLMKKFLFGRIKKVLNARQDIINNQLESAKKANEQAEQKLEDYESKIAGYKDESDKIISDAKDSAKVEYDKIISKAEADAKELKTEAKAQIEADAENAKKAAREEIASLAMEAAEKVVGANVSAQTDSAIFDEFLNEGDIND